MGKSDAEVATNECRIPYTYTIGPEDPLSAAIVYAVSEYLDCNPLEMPELLHDVVDVDALESLFAHPGSTHSSELSFDYCELTITVNDETVVLDATTDTNRRS